MSEVEARMADEIREAPEAVRRQQDELAQPLAELVARLKRRPPQVVVTCARGSSAHAATFGKHLIERYIGLPVAAAAPNIASVYRRPLLWAEPSNKASGWVVLPGREQPTPAQE